MRKMHRISVSSHLFQAYEPTMEPWPAPQYAPSVGGRADPGAAKKTRGVKDALYLGVIIALVLVVAAVAYRFVWRGSTQQTEDGRVGILLEPGERALILEEMRRFVSGLEGLVDALARGNMPDLAKASRSLGASVRAASPGRLTGKLPFEFKLLALETHAAFDTIAMDAEWFALPERSLTQIAQVLEKCDACHDRYRIVAASAP